MKRLLILSVVLLASCGGGGNEVESLDQLGEMLTEQGIDCSELKDENVEMLVREDGSCEDIDVYVFNDSENRDAYLEIAENFGGGPYVVGENWIVVMPDQDAAEDLAESLGNAEVR